MIIMDLDIKVITNYIGLIIGSTVNTIYKRMSEREEELRATSR